MIVVIYIDASFVMTIFHPSPKVVGTYVVKSPTPLGKLESSRGMGGKLMIVIMTSH